MKKIKEDGRETFIPQSRLVLSSYLMFQVAIWYHFPFSEELTLAVLFKAGLLAANLTFLHLRMSLFHLHF